MGGAQYQLCRRGKGKMGGSLLFLLKSMARMQQHGKARSDAFIKRRLRSQEALMKMEALHRPAVSSRPGAVVAKSMLRRVPHSTDLGFIFFPACSRCNSSTHQEVNSSFLDRFTPVTRASFSGAPAIATYSTVVLSVVLRLLSVQSRL